MRFSTIVLLCGLIFASLTLAIDAPAASQPSSFNNDAAVAAVVTFLAGAGLWFVVFAIAAGRERG
jgi:hypothetical protein